MATTTDWYTCCADYSDGEVGDRVEGIQEMSESTDSPNGLKPTTVRIVRSQFDIKEFSAEEAVVFLVGVAFEGRGECDAQDALLTLDETKPAHNAQTMLSVSPDFARV
ncbi:MAG: hypothetical protein K8I60_00070 [Anaerolineae bacterium]|nr:hypothetical protein [Anaerolineae bacterium]